MDTNTDPTCSVIIPTYNGEPFVGDAIESVLQQEIDGEFELLLSDDGSDDGTVRTIRSYEGENVRTILQNENRGVAGNINDAVEASRGDVLAFLDQDDLWHEDKLATHLDRHDEGAEIVYSDIDVIDASGTRTGTRHLPGPQPSGRPLVRQLLRELNFIETLSCATVSRATWDDLGGLSEEFVMAADFDFWLRAAAVSRFTHVTRPLVAKRLHEENLSDDQRRMYEDNVRILRKTLVEFPSLAGLEDEILARLESQRAIYEYHRGNPTETVTFGVRSLTREWDLQLAGYVGIALLDRIGGPLTPGRALYDGLDRISEIRQT